MRTFRLIVTTTGREEYLVEAATAAKAQELWDDGEVVAPVIAEVLDADVVSITEDLDILDLQLADAKNRPGVRHP
jgi:hypothetical protein